MYETLRDNLGQGGVFDFQRRKNDRDGSTFMSQFSGVANYNVGLFCQQAGFSLFETLSMAGAYALANSSNAQLNWYFLRDENRYYIKAGWEAGQSGVLVRGPDGEDTRICGLLDNHSNL
jgi:hypothetical protein